MKYHNRDVLEFKAGNIYRRGRNLYRRGRNLAVLRESGYTSAQTLSYYTGVRPVVLNVSKKASILVIYEGLYEV